MDSSSPCRGLLPRGLLQVGRVSPYVAFACRCRSKCCGRSHSVPEHGERAAGGAVSFGCLRSRSWNTPGCEGPRLPKSPCCPVQTMRFSRRRGRRAMARCNACATVWASGAVAQTGEEKDIFFLFRTAVKVNILVKRVIP